MDFNPVGRIDQNQNSQTINNKNERKKNKIEGKIDTVGSPLFKEEADKLNSQNPNFLSNSSLSSPKSETVKEVIQSSPVFGNIKTLSKQEDIEKKCGQMWKCVDRIVDTETREYSYLFEIEDPYNFLLTKEAQRNREKKIPEIYPALEPENFNLLYLDPEYSIDDFIQLIYKINLENKLISSDLKELEEIRNTTERRQGGYYENGNKLNKLGFESGINKDGIFQLKLPSRDNLLVRWSNLQKEIPTLPNISILESGDIAEDEEFINAFLKYDMILSDGKEFLHDHTVHLIPTLIELIRNPKIYQETRNRIATQVEQVLQDIEKVERIIQSGGAVPVHVKEHLLKVKEAVSAAVDIWTARPKPWESFAPDDDYIKNFVNFNAWDGELGQQYWKNKYPKENLDFKILASIGREILEVIKKFENEDRENKLQVISNKIDSLKKETMTLSRMLELQNLINEQLRLMEM